VDLRRFNGQTTQESVPFTSSHGRDDVKTRVICADATGDRRKTGGILRGTGEPPQRGRYRRQQTGFEGGPALDAFLGKYVFNANEIVLY
jgi:hypothetical protein